MYRLSRRRKSSEVSESGDDKVETVDKVPELAGGIQLKNWTSGGLHSQSESEPGHGDGEGSEGHSEVTSGYPETARDPEPEPDVNEVENEPDEIVAVVQSVPELTTVRELLQLPTFHDPQVQSLLVKRAPTQKSVGDRALVKDMTFTPANTFRTDLEGQPWAAVDDGIFIGSPLPVAKSNVNRLKDRIWRETAQSGTEWFTHANPFVMSNPYRQVPVELCDDLEVIMRRLVTFRPAEVNQVEHFHHRPLLPGRCELTLEVDTIWFFHHPLFSKEHVLAQKVKTAFAVYSKRLEQSQSDRLDQRLRALRDTLRHTKHVLELGSDQATLARLQKRLKKYRAEIELVRHQRDESLRQDKLAMKSVLDEWQLLKKLRTNQQFTNTAVHVKILSAEVNVPREKVIWEEDIEEEFRDIQDSFAATFDRQIRTYRRNLRRWKSLQRVPAEKPFEGGEGVESTGSERSMTLKPSPPDPFQEVKVRQEIRQKFEQLKRLPTEPKLTLELDRTPVSPVTDFPASSVASAEARRRKAMQERKIELRVWFNMKTSYSENRFLSNDFTVPFHVTVKLPISEVPSCLHLELRQESRSLQVIPLPIPSSTAAFERSTVETLRFEGIDNQAVKSGHGGVGAGTKFTVLDQTYNGLPVSGELTLRSGWSLAPDGTLMCPKGLEDLTDENPQRPDPSRDHEVEPDPNNPKIVPYKTIVASDPGHQVDSMMSRNSAEFCDWSEIQGSNRLRLLYLRDQGIFEFKNLRMIPASETDILPDVFQDYEKRLVAEKVKDSNEIWKELAADPENLNEWDRLQPIRLLRTKLLESFEIAAKVVTFEDVVFEEQIPDIGTLGLNIMQIFQPRRNLRPVRKERKKIQTTIFMPTEISLVVNIVRAINLPLRKDSQMQSLTTESLTGVSLPRKSTWALGVVKPFVEVWFQRKVSRTTTGIGSDPTWNQELQIPLMLEKEDGESILGRMEEQIYLQVYDEVAIDLLEDERRRETDVHHRLEKRWLGCIRIPFATLYRAGRIEGTFPLDSPPILLGYESKGGTQGIAEAFLTLFITLQPSISPGPSLNEVGQGTGESAEMLDHVKIWMAQLTKIGKTVRPFVLSPTGDTVLACRFLKGIEPPPELVLEGEVTTVFEKMELLAHYVSLFPSLRDSCSNVGSTKQTLWFTPDLFVATPGGGRDDHAVLLASFFLNLSLKSYIVQGESIDGDSVQVLTQAKRSDDTGSSLKHPLLWNPCTGMHSGLSHAHGSVHTVTSVIGQYNIWANISTKPSTELDWDVDKSKDWLALFPKPISEAKLPRLEFSPVQFSEPDGDEGARVGQKIERHLREHFMKWRPSRTSWNRYSSTKLRLLLPLLEDRRTEGSPSLVQEEHLGELKDILKSFEMTGFPLHQPYSTLESVLETVYATGLHTIDTPDVQFALGAYARAYPASVYSLWVYIAALHPIK